MAFDLLPGENVLWTADPAFELPIKRTKSGVAAAEPLTVCEALKRSADLFANKAALMFKRGDQWEEMTYAHYYETVKKAAKSFLALGLSRFESVNIIGFNSPEWFIADLGCILAGGIATGIYTTNGPDACYYIADHSKARVAVVENEVHLQKFLKIWDKLPNLKAIVVYDPAFVSNNEKIYRWTDFLQLGLNVSDEALKNKMDTQRPGHCCTLIYTSGTTGNPKAVMISHDNVTWTAKVVLKFVGVTCNERVISFLPLSHIAAQIVDIHGVMVAGGTIYFAHPDALRGSLSATLKEVRPTIFLGVPRVWEKIQEKMQELGSQSSFLRKLIVRFAKERGLKGGYALMDGKPLPWFYSVFETLIYKKVKTALGLDECKLCYSAAAPISRDTLEFFMSLGVHVMEIYGMSECAGPQCVSIPSNFRVGYVGPSMDGTELRIVEPDSNGDGEVCFKGRNVFMGYMHNREATAETIDNDGFLHSGDVGQLNDEGLLRITGRIKEIIITAGGENVAPVPIEDSLKGLIPELSNAMIVGDKQKFLTVLLTIRLRPSSDGLGFTNELAPLVAAKLNEKGISCSTVEDLVQNSTFRDYINDKIAAHNKTRAVSQAQTIKKWKILSSDFSIDGGELTPSLKLKRRVVLEKFSGVIEQFYQ